MYGMIDSPGPSPCCADSIPRDARLRVILVSLLLAGGMIAGGLSRTLTGLPEWVDLATRVGCVMLGALLLEPYARVRRLPLVAGVLIAAALLSVHALRAGDAAMPGGGVMVGLLLSFYARSWAVGLGVVGLLTAAELLASVI